jgi:hypothetical protein
LEKVKRSSGNHVYSKNLSHAEARREEKNQRKEKPQKRKMGSGFFLRTPRLRVRKSFSGGKVPDSQIECIKNSIFWRKTAL